MNEKVFQRKLYDQIGGKNSKNYLQFNLAAKTVISQS